MASLRSLGPAHLFCSFPNVSSPGYLGTAEQFPIPAFQHVFNPVYNDIGGTVPIDQSFQGTTATIAADVNRMNWPVYSILSSQPRNAVNPLGIYGDGPLDVGSLLVTHGRGFMLTIVNGYYNTPNNIAGSPPGWQFYRCFMATDAVEPGTQPAKVRMVFVAQRTVNLVQGGGFEFPLYNQSFPVQDFMALVS